MRKRTDVADESTSLAPTPRRLVLPPQPPIVPATRPDDEARARLERHLRRSEGLPAPLARELAARRAQAWALRQRLRDEDARAAREHRDDQPPRKAA